MSGSGIPFPPPRPATPQVLIHHLPQKPSGESDIPRKFLILITGSTGVAGKVQIAQLVSKALGCPSYSGDSLHESSAKAANVGAARQQQTSDGGGGGILKPNEARYQRMWLSKMTRTGLLFPEESRPANEAAPSVSSASTSRRGSASSVSSVTSHDRAPSSVGSSVSGFDSLHTASSGKATAASAGRVENSFFTVSESERARRANPALMLSTHPMLEQWHRDAIRSSLKDYGIGVIFVPLDDEYDEDEDEDDLPILQPLDPRTMSSFPLSMASFRKPAIDYKREIKVKIDVEAGTEARAEEIIERVRAIMDP